MYIHMCTHVHDFTYIHVVVHVHTTCVTITLYKREIMESTCHVCILCIMTTFGMHTCHVRYVNRVFYKTNDTADAV